MVAADGWSVVSATFAYSNVTTMTPAQQQNEICGSLPAFAAYGLDASGMFAYPNNAWDGDVREGVTDFCFNWGRTYGGQFQGRNWAPEGDPAVERTSSGATASPAAPATPWVLPAPPPRRPRRASTTRTHRSTAHRRPAHQRYMARPSVLQTGHGQLVAEQRILLGLHLERSHPALDQRTRTVLPGRLQRHPRQLPGRYGERRSSDRRSGLGTNQYPVKPPPSAPLLRHEPSPHDTAQGGGRSTCRERRARRGGPDPRVRGSVNPLPATERPVSWACLPLPHDHPAPRWSPPTITATTPSLDPFDQPWRFEERPEPLSNRLHGASRVQLALSASGSPPRRPLAARGGGRDGPESCAAQGTRYIPGIAGVSPSPRRHSSTLRTRTMTHGSWRVAVRPMRTLTTPSRRPADASVTSPRTCAGPSNRRTSATSGGAASQSAINSWARSRNTTTATARCPSPSTSSTGTTRSAGCAAPSAAATP